MRSGESSRGAHLLRARRGGGAVAAAVRGSSARTRVVTPHGGVEKDGVGRAAVR